jgi:hypothetical protein
MASAIPFPVSFLESVHQGSVDHAIRILVPNIPLLFLFVSIDPVILLLY